jgi:putative transcriptional regulator
MPPIRSIRFALFASLLGLLLCSKVASPGADEPARFTAGQLLLATPEMRDPRFSEAVIYMVRHQNDGAMGLVINRPLAKGPIRDLLKGFGIESEEAKGEVVIHYGGPVSLETGYVLHSDDFMLDGSESVADGVAVTGDAKIIEAMGLGKGPRDALVVLGYAGWAPGQLEGELRAGAWHVIPGDRDIVFGKDPDKKWRRAMDRRKIPL